MPRMTRFGVSLEEGLLKKFDERLLEAGYRNRSAALRDIIRQFLNSKGRLGGGQAVYAVVSLVLHKDQETMAGLCSSMEDIEHLLKGSQQHLGRGEYFLHSLVLYGPSESLEKAASRLQSLKGVLASSVSFLPCLPPCHAGTSKKPPMDKIRPD